MYLVFIAFIALDEVIAGHSRLEQVVTLAALALFVVLYVGFWSTRMTSRGWTSDLSRRSVGLAAGLCVIAVSLSLVRFQTFGYLMIFCSAALAGLFPGRWVWLGVLGPPAATALLTLVTRADLANFGWITLICLMTGIGTAVGWRMSRYGTDLRLAR